MIIVQPKKRYSLENETKHIILFDGVCNLCNSSVQYIIKHDKKDTFRFAAIESTVGQVLTKKLGINTNKIDSIILIEPRKAYYLKLDAVLKIAYQLNPLWNVLRVFNFLPSKIKNLMYDYIAKNRYKWYGKSDTCMRPTPNIKAKFLD